MKLLRSGATVIGTTRLPQAALDLYKKYTDFSEWESRLDVYHKGLDLDDRLDFFFS